MSRPSAALHSSASPDWCTPLPIITAARGTMGGIDLDPASTPEANLMVGATRIYTAADDGLVQPWHGRVFLNPPGGLVKDFWRRLIAHWMDQVEGHPRAIEQAIWIGYSLEQLQMLQNVGAPAVPTDFVLCVPKKRLRFSRPDGSTPTAPTHANYIAYLGPHPSRFIVEFSAFGGIA